MDETQAATFLASTILIGLGISIVGVVIVFLNNIFSKYWKPVQFSIIPDAIRNHPPVRFAEPHELNEVSKTAEPKLK